MKYEPPIHEVNELAQEMYKALCLTRPNTIDRDSHGLRGFLQDEARKRLISDEKDRVRKAARDEASVDA